MGKRQVIGGELWHVDSLLRGVKSRFAERLAGRGTGSSPTAPLTAPQDLTLPSTVATRKASDPEESKEVAHVSSTDRQTCLCDCTGPTPACRTIGVLHMGSRRKPQPGTTSRPLSEHDCTTWFYKCACSRVVFLDKQVSGWTDPRAVSGLGGYLLGGGRMLRECGEVSWHGT